MTNKNPWLKAVVLVTLSCHTVCMALNAGIRIKIARVYRAPSLRKWQEFRRLVKQTFKTCFLDILGKNQHHVLVTVGKQVKCFRGESSFFRTKLTLYCFRIIYFSAAFKKFWFQDTIFQQTIFAYSLASVKADEPHSGQEEPCFPNSEMPKKTSCLRRCK